MIKDIFQKEKLLYYAQELKKKKFKPGFDGMSAQSALLWLEINGETLIRRLLRGSYDPMPAVGFYTAKQNGGYRQLAKLSALDMVIQNTLISGVTPACESQFSDYTYAYRPNRGVTAAVRSFCEYGSRCAYAAVIDPNACYDNIDHEVLESALLEMLQEEAIVALMMKYVRMPVFSEGEIHYVTKGILQGAPLSNLMCNIYFTSLDRYLAQNGIPFIR